MKKTAVVTIVSNNYLHYARTLMQSVALQHPEAERYCVIVDTDMAPGAALADEFTAIAMPELGLPYGDDFYFQYTILELNTAVKPWALEHLLDRGHSEVLYIDPDIYLYRPLEDVMRHLSSGASIVLTPHMLAPYDDDRNPTEASIRMAGTYNLGFCAIAERLETRAFLRWWQGKLARDCVVDMPNGVFVDQSWIDLVPGMFDNVRILRHPGYNVAYWNLAQRSFAQGEGGLLVNGEPLMFFHYSGIDPQNPQPVSKHQDRHNLDSVGAIVRGLFVEYCQRVVANGQENYRKLPYGYATFRDGSPIPAPVRAAYRVSGQLRLLAAGKPFDHPALARSSAFTGPARLTGIYKYFLGRPADVGALRDFSHRCTTLPGYLRTAIGVGRSAESRREPGWVWRLLMWPVAGMRMTPTAHAPAAMPDAAPAGEPARARAHEAAPAPDCAPGINLVGYIAAELGIGEAARSLARACAASGVPYSVVDVGYQTSNLQRDTQALANASARRYEIDLLYVNADQTPRTVAHLKSKGLSSRYRIGFWHWEQPQLPDAHLGAFSELDEIWVPSNFVRDAVAAVSPLPVVVIPHALQFAPTPGIARSAFGLPDDKTLALVMYDFHSYQHRKNPQAAIAAFRMAQAGRTDCALVVKTINGSHHPEAEAELRASLADLPGTVVIDEFLTRQQTWDLQSCCDMLVSLHRAEGFGLAPAEMMYLGKPVVATGWSANMDFMDAENSMPVHYTLAPLAEAVGAYPAGPLWAEADVGHAAECIRRLLDDAGLREAIGQRAARDVRRQLHPDTVGKLVADRLKALARWYPALAKQ
ncbi:glycosyltransferase family 4 protein [Massilia sp. GCM10020059]|uniref:Glycosyltransferase family 4 protein n=1 Tax=Massilia agrisoli TaxID=2892444 RepID=A0ABS8INW9_9BURK|nr:glycosyltransferase family 4 protein [Massilia agrisoli]MCC6069492.1 glycosyltransferase family 4 protein [Massilia agrisoli]